MDFYDSGEYYDELCRIAGRKIEHHVLRMSSRRQKFYNQIDPKPGWDDDDRARARSNLIEQLIEAIAARGKK